MASRGSRGGAGERVLESRHVIGLFMLMLVFSGVFFALGYVMGRNQYDGQVRAAGNPRATPDPFIPPKQVAAPKRSRNSPPPPSSTPAPDAASDENSQPSSDWGFYNAGKVAPDDRLKPAATTMPPSSVPAIATSKTPSHAANVSSKSASGSQAPAGSYTLQVAALRKEADAQAIASSLLKKKFPAFVVSPTSDKYFHVQVGPYSDSKSAEAAKKGLENAGFKAIVKH
jgi:septal ring-binding cell division protein DamX